MSRNPGITQLYGPPSIASGGRIGIERGHRPLHVGQCGMGGKPGYGFVEQSDFRYDPIPVLEKVHGHAAHVDDRTPRMAPVRSASSFDGRIVAGEWSRDLHLFSKTLTRSARTMTTTFNVAR